MNKEIMIADTGSNAAYKIASEVCILVKQHAVVKVIMKPSSSSFLTPLTFTTLTKDELLVELSCNSKWACLEGYNNKISIFENKGDWQHLETSSKTELVKKIINSIIHYTHE
ncbi:MAG: hypothetical protein WD135_03905 [Ferruginibacter sp.]